MFSEQTTNKPDYIWKYLVYGPSLIGTAYIIAAFLCTTRRYPGVVLGTAQVCKLKGKSSLVIAAVATNFLAVAPCCHVSA